MADREFTPAEQYCARKMGSKLTRALVQLKEARDAANGLGTDLLKEMNVPHFYELLQDIKKNLVAVRGEIRKAVPVSSGVESWERGE